MSYYKLPIHCLFPKRVWDIIIQNLTTYEEILKFSEADPKLKELIVQRVGTLSIKLIPRDFIEPQEAIKWIENRVDKHRVTSNCTTVELHEKDWHAHFASVMPEYKHKTATDDDKEECKKIWKKWLREIVLTEETIARFKGLQFIVVEIHELSGNWTRSNSFNVVPLDFLFDNLGFNNETDSYELIDISLPASPKTNIHINYCTLLSNILCDDTNYNCTSSELCNCPKPLPKQQCNEKERKDHFKLNYGKGNPPKEPTPSFEYPSPINFSPLKTPKSTGYLNHPSCAVFKPLLPVVTARTETVKPIYCTIGVLAITTLGELTVDQSIEKEDINTGVFLGSFNEAGLTVDDLCIKDLQISGSSETTNKIVKHTFHIPKKLAVTVDYLFIPHYTKVKLNDPYIDWQSYLYGMAFRSPSSFHLELMTKYKSNFLYAKLNRDVKEFLRDEERFNSEKANTKSLEDEIFSNIDEEKLKNYQSPYKYERELFSERKLFTMLHNMKDAERKLKSLKKEIQGLMKELEKEEKEAIAKETFEEDECGFDIPPVYEPAPSRIKIEQALLQFAELKKQLLENQITPDIVKEHVKPDVETLVTQYQFSSRYEAQCHQSIESDGHYLEKRVKMFHEGLLQIEQDPCGSAFTDFVRFKRSLNVHEFIDVCDTTIIDYPKRIVKDYFEADESTRFEDFAKKFNILDVNDPPVVPKIDLKARGEDRRRRVQEHRWQVHLELLKEERKAESKAKKEQFWVNLKKKFQRTNN